ncbi:MAG: SRPBCC family protein [Dermatophilaceae bacterium]
MGTFRVERSAAVPPQRVWEVITDWESHARWIPLTTMRLDPGPPRVGWSFAGLTGVGRLRFADVMRITEWSPPAGAGPGKFRLVKVGHLLAGWAEVSVLPLEGGRHTRLLWRENIVIRPVAVGRLLGPLTDRLNKALFSRVVDAMVAEAVGAPGQGPGRQ